MKIFFDTEFIEGPQPRKFLGIKYGETPPTIDLISIGMVRENGQTLYLLNNECNIDHAWSNEWIRDNVLAPIHKESFSGDVRNRYPFTRKTMKMIFKNSPWTKERLRKRIKGFCGTNPEFYAYFADYDWVVFCQLFGRMIDLPKGFPMYCKDLKQQLDALVSKIARKTGMTFDEALADIKTWDTFPTQENEHNALDDAKWNKNLYDFIRNHAQHL